MKRTHIILLVGIAALIVALMVYSAGDFSTYETISSAQKNKEHLYTLLQNSIKHNQ